MFCNRSKVVGCLSVSLGLMAIGCGSEFDAAEGSDGDPGAESVGTADEALSRSGVYIVQTTATTTYKEVAIGNHSACFIVGVAGGFNNATNSIRVGSDTYTGDLSNRAFSVEVIGPRLTAYVACINNNGTVTPSLTIDSSSFNNTNFGSASNRICFLDSLRGHFWTQRDYVRIVESGGNWIGVANTSGEYISASASCLTTVTASERSAQDFTLTPPGGQYVTMNLDLPIDSGSTKGFCAFTQIGGVFNATNDYLSVGQGTGSLYWTIRGRSDQAVSLVYGSARCIISAALL